MSTTLGTPSPVVTRDEGVPVQKRGVRASFHRLGEGGEEVAQIGGVLRIPLRLRVQEGGQVALQPALPLLDRVVRGGAGVVHVIQSPHAWRNLLTTLMKWSTRPGSTGFAMMP